MVIAAKTICTLDSATDKYSVSNDPDTVINKEGNPFVAVALSAMTNTYGGYYWCGGVCPADMIKSGATYVLDGNYLTDASLAIGPMMVSDCTGDFLGFTVLAATGAACGWSSTADTDT